MAIQEKTIDEIQQDLINFVVTYNADNDENIDYRTGTVFRDIVIDAPSVELNILWTDLVAAAQVFSINYASTTEDADMDNMAANYGLIRNTSTTATTTQTFITTTLPTVDIVINAGTIVATQATNDQAEIQFQTTETVAMSVSSIGSYKFGNTWRINAPVTAILGSANGNVGSNTITEIKQSITGIQTTTNAIAATGGSDQESNVELANRIKLRLTGNNVGTENGIKSLMLENSDVRDVSIVKPGDYELIRNEFGGSIDVYIDGQNVEQYIEQYTYRYISPDRILIRQPASGILSITGTVGGANYTFIEGVDFMFVEDMVSLYYGSTLANNIIRFGIGGTNPDNETLVTITYIYNKLIYDLQETINSSKNHIVAADILIREAIPASISMVISVTLYSGYTRSSVSTQIQTNVSTHINNLTLGTSFNKSDIIAIVENVAGVDSVDISTFKVSKNNVEITTQTINIYKYEFTEFNTLDIIILA